MSPWANSFTLSLTPVCSSVVRDNTYFMGKVELSPGWLVNWIRMFTEFSSLALCLDHNEALELWTGRLRSMEISEA